MILAIKDYILFLIGGDISKEINQINYPNLE
jgi:hypothetical protein